MGVDVRVHFNLGASFGKAGKSLNLTSKLLIGQDFSLGLAHYFEYLPPN
jgi:hypothetical protein